MASKDDNYSMSLRDAVSAALNGEASYVGQGTYLNHLLQQLGIDVTIPELYNYGDSGESNSKKPEQTAAQKAYHDAAIAKIDAGLKVEGLGAQDAGGAKVYQQRVVDSSGNVKATVNSDWENPDGFITAMPYVIAAGLGAGFAAAATGAGGAAATGAGSAAGGAGAGAGAFTLPVSAGAVGPVGSAGWSSLGSVAAGGGAAGGIGAAASGGSLAAPATNAALIDSSLGTAGYGASSAGLGGGPGVLSGVGATVGGGGSGLFGTGMSAGQIASGLGVAGQVIGGIKGFSDASKLEDAGKAADPFAPYRAGYAEMLQRLMADPSSVTTLPGYQFGLDESNRVLTQNLASQGLTGSGTAAKAITHNATDYAGKFYQQQLQTLAGLGGANINNAGLSLQAQSAGASLENQSINNLAKLIPTVAGWFGS